jgi:hypothetical protein
MTNRDGYELIEGSEKTRYQGMALSQLIRDIQNTFALETEDEVVLPKVGKIDHVWAQVWVSVPIPSLGKTKE